MHETLETLGETTSKVNPDANFTPGDWENRPDYIDVGYAKIRVKPPKWVFAHNPRGSVLSCEEEEYAVL